MTNIAPGTTIRLTRNVGPHRTGTEFTVVRLMNRPTRDIGPDVVAVHEGLSVPVAFSDDEFEVVK